MKKRIKRALASFLKDELLEFIGYEKTIPINSISETYVVEHIEFETIQLQEVVDLNAIQYPMEFEDIMERIKESFFEKVVEAIHVDTKELTHGHFSNAKSIRMTLRVQKPK